MNSPEVGGLHLAEPGEVEEARRASPGRTARRHPLLRLGDQDLPGREPLVLERRASEVEPRPAGLLRHLAHRGGQAARAVVGDGRVEAQVAGLEQEVEHLLLGDGVADLHGLDRALLGELRRGEGRAVDAVLADAAADHDDAVARAGRASARRGAPAMVTGMRPTVPQKTSGLPRKRSSKNSQPRPYGNARLVAAVDDAGVHALEDPARVEEPRGQLALPVRAARSRSPRCWRAGRRRCRCRRIAVHAHDAGDGAAVRVEGRGAVVGLHLVDEVEASGGLDDPGVVVEDRDEPALPLAGADGLVDGLGGAADEGLEDATGSPRAGPPSSR